MSIVYSYQWFLIKNCDNKNISSSSKNLGSVHDCLVTTVCERKYVKKYTLS